jgi:hypothetical protein
MITVVMLIIDIPVREGRPRGGGRVDQMDHNLWIHRPQE